MQVGHERSTAGADGRGVGRTGLILAIDVAVGVTDVDFPELRQQIDTSTVGRPEFGMALLALMDIARQEGAPVAISLTLQSLNQSAVARWHILPHLL